MIVSRSVLFRMKNYLDKVVEKIKMHILYTVTFFPQESYRLWGNVEKYGTVRGHRYKYNMAHVNCMLDG